MKIIKKTAMTATIRVSKNEYKALLKRFPSISKYAKNFAMSSELKATKIAQTSQVEVEFDYMLEGDEGDIMLHITAIGQVAPAEPEVGYNHPHIAYTEWNATDINGRPYTPQGYDYQAIDREATEKLTAEIENQSF